MTGPCATLAAVTCAATDDRPRVVRATSRVPPPRPNLLTLASDRVERAVIVRELARQGYVLRATAEALGLVSAAGTIRASDLLRRIHALGLFARYQRGRARVAL